MIEKKNCRRVSAKLSRAKLSRPRGISVLGIDNEENDSKVVGIATIIAWTSMVSFHFELII